MKLLPQPVRRNPNAKRVPPSLGRVLSKYNAKIVFPQTGMSAAGIARDLLSSG
jgi:hypothetical protein